jgi:AbiV family abortive infection protein
MVFKDEDIHSAMGFCLKSAENLVAEAKLLYDAERFPRAYCLAVQAMSELGKRSLLAINLGGKLNDNRSLEKFHKQWLSAENCLLLSLMTGSMQEFSREEYSDLIRLSRLWLMRGHDLMGVEVYAGPGCLDQSFSAEAA